MKGIYRLVRRDPEWLSIQLIRVEEELDRRQHRGAGFLAATNYANKLRKALRIQENHRHNGRRRYVDTERK